MKLKNKAKRNERILAFQQSAVGRGGKCCVACLPNVLTASVTVSCRANSNRKELSKVLNLPQRAIFSTHWPHFNVRWRQKRWSEGCWLAAFSDKDEGFVLWQSPPLRPWRHCSASSQPRNVTAKSVKPQQRQLLFFNTVEVKLVKKKKKEKSETWKTNKPLPNSTLRSPLFCLFLLFSRTEKSQWQEFHLSFTIRTFSGGGCVDWTTSEKCANGALVTCIQTRDLPCISLLSRPVMSLIS